MTADQRIIKTLRRVQRIGIGAPPGGVTIYYGRHPDSNEILVKIDAGTAGRGDDIPDFPLEEWSKLDLEDPAVIAALFDESDLWEIRKIISERDNPSSEALLRYMFKIIGDVL